MSDEDKHRAAERFVSWLEESVVLDGRGDELSFSEVNPIGRFWLGRLGPKDFVTLGYFIPARRNRSDADKEAMREAATRWQAVLHAEGISEDEAVAGFKEWRTRQKR